MHRKLLYLAIALSCFACSPKQEKAKSETDEGEVATNAVAAASTAPQKFTINRENLRIDPRTNTSYASSAELIDQPDGSAFIRVSTIEGVEANKDFQINSQLLLSQQRAILKLQEKLKSISNTGEREKLQSEIDERMEVLKRDNALMSKHFQFSITHKYAQIIEKSSLYLGVTPEEIKRFEARKRSQSEP